MAKGCVNCLHSTRKRSTRLLRSDCSCSGSQSSFNHCRNQCGKILARITWKKFWKRSCNKKYVFVNEQYIDKRSKMIHIINSNIFIRCINFNCLAMLASSRFKSNTNFVGHTSWLISGVFVVKCFQGVRWHATAASTQWTASVPVPFKINDRMGIWRNSTVPRCNGEQRYNVLLVIPVLISMIYCTSHKFQCFPNLENSLKQKNLCDWLHMLGYHSDI